MVFEDFGRALQDTVWNSLRNACCEGKGTGVRRGCCECLELAGYYAGRLKEIAGGSLAHERGIRDWLERQLITDRGLRNQIIRDAKNQSVDDDSLQALIQAWLVRDERRGGRIWIEIYHDR